MRRIGFRWLSHRISSSERTLSQARRVWHLHRDFGFSNHGTAWSSMDPSDLGSNHRWWCTGWSTPADLLRPSRPDHEATELLRCSFLWIPERRPFVNPSSVLVSEQFAWGQQPHSPCVGDSEEAASWRFEWSWPWSWSERESDSREPSNFAGPKAAWSNCQICLGSRKRLQWEPESSGPSILGCKH